MDTARANHLAQLVKTKKADKPCPRCGHLHFSIVGESALGINPPGMWGMSTQQIPTVVIACSNCGYLSLHATAIVEKRAGLLGGAQ